ncbi:hypothetical protein CNR22_12025 [Sphingobacteriaceae bacterium]|nr:hypothetical protein CNR22_12025 [Sphingobacteriaceae bacterium]
MEKLTVVKAKILKHNFDYFIACASEAEKISSISNSLLKSRALDITNSSISAFLANDSIENLKWIIESVNNFARIYPENILNKTFPLLDDEMDKTFKLLVEINKGLYLDRK